MDFKGQNYANQSLDLAVQYVKGPQTHEKVDVFRYRPAPPPPLKFQAWKTHPMTLWTRFQKA